MDTNKKKKAPVFMVIADDLRERINRDIPPGGRLPTEAELSAEYSTTRTTVRAALQVLINALVVEKRGLSGYFVREVTARTWQLINTDDGTYADPWQTLTDTEGAERARQLIAVRIDQAGIPLGATTLGVLLDVADDALVACRSAVRCLDGEPVDLTDIYAPYDLVKDTPFMSSSDELDVYALMETTGRMTGSADSFTFRNPAPGEKARLELPEATGVVEVVRRLDYDTDQAMVIHSVYSAAGARFITYART